MKRHLDCSRLVLGKGEVGRMGRLVFEPDGQSLSLHHPRAIVTRFCLCVCGECAKSVRVEHSRRLGQVGERHDARSGDRRHSTSSQLRWHNWTPMKRVKSGFAVLSSTTRGYNRDECKKTSCQECLSTGSFVGELCAGGRGTGRTMAVTYGWPIRNRHPFPRPSKSIIRNPTRRTASTVEIKSTRTFTKMPCRREKITHS